MRYILLLLLLLGRCNGSYLRGVEEPCEEVNENERNLVSRSSYPSSSTSGLTVSSISSSQSTDGSSFPSSSTPSYTSSSSGPTSITSLSASGSSISSNSIINPLSSGSYSESEKNFDDELPLRLYDGSYNEPSSSYTDDSFSSYVSSFEDRSDQNPGYASDGFFPQLASSSYAISSYTDKSSSTYFPSFSRSSSDRSGIDDNSRGGMLPISSSRETYTSESSSSYFTGEEEHGDDSSTSSYYSSDSFGAAPPFKDAHSTYSSSN